MLALSRYPLTSSSESVLVSKKIAMLHYKGQVIKLNSCNSNATLLDDPPFLEAKVGGEQLEPTNPIQSSCQNSNGKNTHINKNTAPSTFQHLTWAFGR